MPDHFSLKWHNSLKAQQLLFSPLSLQTLPENDYTLAVNLHFTPEDILEIVFFFFVSFYFYQISNNIVFFFNLECTDF